MKLNAVALKGVNEDEIAPMIAWAHGRAMDVTLIEVMPLGEIEPGRIDQFLPLSVVRERLARSFTLTDLPERTGGPARYVRVEETGGKLGFITPLTHNFCEGCNRVRLTCTGRLYMCLGQEDAADLRTPMRLSEGNERLEAAIAEAISRKPRGHDFVIDRAAPAVGRHMSVTGRLRPASWPDRSVDEGCPSDVAARSSLLMDRGPDRAFAEAEETALVSPRGIVYRPAR